MIHVAPAGCQLLDLHNHTWRSYDSSNTYDDYLRAHEQGRFDVLAITDHNRVEGALEVADRARGVFETIVGQEIDTADGELIGLFLTGPVDEGLSAVETAAAIREQGGLVYLQHPFYRLIRHRLRQEAIKELAKRNLVDVVEGINGGPFMWVWDAQARAWAQRYDVVCAAGSDAHHPGDIGRCVVAVPPGEVDAASVKSRLERGVLVDRRRASLASLGARARYAVDDAVRRRRRDAQRKSRGGVSAAERQTQRGRSPRC